MLTHLTMYFCLMLTQVVKKGLFFLSMTYSERFRCKNGSVLLVNSENIVVYVGDFSSYQLTLKLNSGFRKCEKIIALKDIKMNTLQLNRYYTG